ncbi:MAG: membrane protein insertion efficiency factor YidD [bacterium]
MRRFIHRLAIGGITFYQNYLSPLKPGCCRFYPTCSEYSKESIRRHGLIRGGAKAFLRLLRCHPFHPGGHDPVK